MLLNDLNIKYLTLYTGEKGYHNCYCKCPCCTQKNLNQDYQGKIEQVEKLLAKFKNLKQLYILGNPDPLKDATFCNQVSKLALKKNINLCYSTSGVGGITKINQLISGLNKDKIDYISFSIDSIEPNKMSMLKGINYPFTKVIETIKWLLKNNYKIKIQPTLWSSNYQETYDLIAYFANLGVTKFTFHIGSNETDSFQTHTHLTLTEMQEVFKMITKASSKYQVQITCPVIYSDCFNDLNKWYCMQPEKCQELLAYLKKDGVYVTNVPIIAEIDTSYLYNINSNIDLKELPKANTCPISSQTAKTKTLCRYVKRIW